MSRIVRFHEPSQPTLPLGHGTVHWDTLPSAVREHVLALWLQLLTEHLADIGAAVHSAARHESVEERQ